MVKEIDVVIKDLSNCSLVVNTHLTSEFKIRMFFAKALARVIAWILRCDIKYEDTTPSHS